MHNNSVIRVDEQDNELGVMDKLQAHQQGVLHRAFSVFIFNSKKEMLLQKRALHKYHSGGLWSNACCSHPQPGENTEQAAIKRLGEEMGLPCGELRLLFKQTYKANVGNQLIEHELDYVYVGYTDVVPQPNKDEVMSYTYKTIPAIISDLKNNPSLYTEWFKLFFEKVVNEVNKS